MMLQALLILEWIIFIFLGVQVAYLLFFSVAGMLTGRKKFAKANKLNRIKVFIPGYKEDSVIVETATKAVAHNYPKDKFEVIIIADSFSPATLNTLRKLPLKVIEVFFEKSTKGKALQTAIESISGDQTDIMVILDADNEMSDGFLHAVNNAFEAGYEVIQGHRTAKNTNTPFAFLDACTEEINNHIFRRGHNAVGLSSALIGSGMAFKWDLFQKLVKNIGETSGEDKELEFRIAKAGKKVLFLDQAFVYDEKVAHQEVFSNQRSRWLAMQLEYFKKYFLEGWMELFKGNIAFFDKVFQTYLLPRVLLVGTLGIWWIITCFWLDHFFIASSFLVGCLAMSLLAGIPVNWYNKKLLAAIIQIPAALFSMIKAILKISKAKQTFIHTPHGEAFIKK